MIERGKIKPYQKLWMRDPLGGLVDAEYLKHWGAKVKVRRWRVRTVTLKTGRAQSRREPFTQLVDPESLFATRDAALGILKATP